MMRIARLALGLLATTFLVSQVQAADMPLKAHAIAPTPESSWTGFYVGVDGGLGGDKISYDGGTTNGLATGTADLTSSGFFAGGQGGYNWQFAPTWVAGIETDIQWSDIQGKVDASANLVGFGVSASAGTKLDYFGTVRARIGYLVTPAALLYATGGWAYGQTTTSLNATAGGGSFNYSSSHDKSGWTAGGGLEYRLNNWASVKTEYLYMDLGTDNVWSGRIGGTPVSINEKTTVQTGKIGLNVKFGAM
jgi:outer membrane immunogenic protein